MLVEGEEPAEADVAQHVWRKHAPWLYDTLLYHLLELPSLSCQFLPAREGSPQSTLSIQKALIGTQTSPAEEENFLMIVKLKTISEFGRQQFAQDFAIARPEQSVLKPGFPSVQVETKLAHSGDVNRARGCPRTYNLIATKSSDGNVYLFDYSKHPPLPRSSKPEPLMTLTGHERQGFGLSWAQGEYLLASGSNDGLVCLWDLGRETSCAEPTLALPRMDTPVNDVCLHRIHPSLLAVGREDGAIALSDLRRAARGVVSTLSGKSEIFSLDFSPRLEFALLAGCGDGGVRLWDLRMTSEPLMAFHHHEQAAVRVSWHPELPGVFSSGSSDNTVTVADCRRGDVLFKHAGHYGAINDLDWCPNVPLGMMSVSDDNCLQYWEVDLGCL